MVNFYFLGFLFASIALFSQSKVEKFEYERNNQLVSAYAFKIESCPKKVILNSWKEMVESNGGKFSLFNQVFESYTAERVVFSRLRELNEMKLFFQVFDYKSDSLLVTNAFQREDNEYILPNMGSEISKSAKEIILDFSFDVRTSCSKYQLRDAMEYAEELHRKIFVLKNQNIYLDKRIIMNHKKIKKLENIVKNLSDQMTFYNKRSKQSNDDFTKNKLDEQYDASSKKNEKLSSRLSAEKAAINESRLRKESNLATIKVLEAEVKSQKLIVEYIQNSLQYIKR